MKKIEICIEGRGREIPQKKFGIFFEDLSHAADGGLYGELVQNRSFEFDAEDNKEYHSMTAWEIVERGDSMLVVHTESTSPLHKYNPHYIVIEGTKIDKSSGIRNIGYNAGILVEQGKRYRFTCFARSRSRKRNKLLVQLEDISGEKIYGFSELGELTNEWRKYECCIEASGTDYAGRLSVLLQKPECVELDMISLFPEDTFLGRENGLRKDLAEKIAELTPGFLRFPGGCLIHVGSLNAEDKSSIYRWKNTVRPVEERPSKRNGIWNYNQTLGLGFYEMFLLCEDLKAEPFPVISAGYDPHFLRKADEEDIQEWIDEALDLIEFANGDVDTKWGSVRAELGHPESFHLKYLTIGNEEVGEGYFENYEIIYQAVRKAHPEIKLINSAICGSYNGKFEDGIAQAARTGTDYIDIHNYSQPEWYLANEEVYNKTPNGSKIFIGEYSTCDDTWYNGLAEAAILTGWEKTESIAFACYAPLLNNVDYSNWKPDLIHFDNHRAYGTPSYYVQKLFMNNQGEALLQTKDNLVHKENEGQMLNGKLSMQSNGADISIRNFTVTDSRSKIAKSFPDFNFTGEKREQDCGESISDAYEITFSFCKKTGGGYLASRGRCALSLFFAELDKTNRIEWNIDGWQRLTSLSGRWGAGTIHCAMLIEIGVEYEAKVVVSDSQVRTYINGVLCNDITCNRLNIRELYYSAVEAENGDIIIKLVNLLEESKEVTIQFEENSEYNVDISYMSGYDLTERNSLDEPEKIVPKYKTETIKTRRYQYIVSGNEVAVLRFCK